MKKLFALLTCLAFAQLGRAEVSSNFKPDSGLVPAATVSAASHAVAHPALNAFESMMAKRLDSIKKDVPLDYNEYVQSYIDKYVARKEDMGYILGKAKYYFPIYEKAFRDAGIPEEIKFLSIVESELNPNAVSRVGATGPWQFMSTTAKNFGLNIDNYVDERRDPIQASYAAAAYIKDAYEEFGDWLLAIASYNCGKSSVERAIEKANALDFWSIRDYLPAETRNYVPAYIAMAYVMNYSKKHHIVAHPCSFSTVTDTVLVNKFVSLSNIARVLSVETKELAILNPAYTRLIVNGTPAAPKRLIIPQVSKEKYSALYDALNGSSLTVASGPVYSTDGGSGAVDQMPAYHVVRRGETLARIADKYGVELNDLKEWNHTTRAVPGKMLRLTAPENASYQVAKNTSASRL